MADKITEPVKKIVAILKAAKTDTEKFAALFMVTKLVKAKDCNSACRKLIFEAVGFRFLKRLLLSAEVPADCPPQVYKSVAMSVLSTLLRDPALAAHPDTLANVAVFLEVVRAPEEAEAEDDDLMLINEAYSCLRAVADTPAGREALLGAGAVAALCEVYSGQSFQTDEALAVLVALAGHSGAAACWGEDPKPFHSIVNKIALDFETDHSERKFELCGVLRALLVSCRKDAMAATASEESWPGSILKGLTDILGSRLGKPQRDPALKLAAAAMEVLGAEWCLGGPEDEKPRQFFLLLVQLCSVEVRMQLEDRSFAQALAEADLISACFTVLELSIALVATDTLDLEQKEKQSLYTALKGAFAAVIALLSKVAKDYPKTKDGMAVPDKVFVYATVRVLAAWLAQETAAMRNAVYALLPFMLTLANETFYAVRSRRLTEKAALPGGGASSAVSSVDPLSEVDVLRMLLPALCHLAVEDQARKILLQAKEEEVLHECFAFHWSVVHAKKPVVPKSERGKAREPDPEPTPAMLERAEDSRAAMVSICNIFMNLTVLEPKLAQDSALFATLLKFIFNNLPELKGSPENLVLHGNMAVLGLLLLRQQAGKVKKNDFSICRYVQATIRFLWDAFDVDESNDPTALVVTMAYKRRWSELAELWFLGMQTLSAVLKLVPWVSEFAVESGWVEGIVDTLHKVKAGSLPSNTRSAYEDFLCHVVDADAAVAKVLKKRDALAVCRTHRLMELGKRLFGD